MTHQRLIEKYQPYLYNLALRLVYYKEDAEDLTQEVWIKILNSIDKFEEKSDFKTWSYRIMMNHFLNEKRKDTKLSFEKFKTTMNNMPDLEISNEFNEPEKQLLINEAKVGCMLGMLLCLEKEQRAILIIGEIFEIKSNVASEIFAITQENFRKKLSRARLDLYNFMNNHCSLINSSSSCKCNKKTISLINENYIDPKNLNFSKNQKNLKQSLQIKSDNLDITIEKTYKDLYQEHPFCNIDEKKFAKELLNNCKIKEIFEL